MSKFVGFWKNLWHAAGGSRPEGYPKSYPDFGPDERVQRPQIFDPSLQHYTSAMRQGEPTFADPEIGKQWFTVRRRIMDHLVHIIGDSAWQGSLILRGSYLMKQWFGPDAREPKDLDFVIRPAHPSWLGLADWGVLNGLQDLIRQRNRIEDADTTLTDMAVDDIWTYDRVPGRRLVITWQAGGLPEGTVQVDLVLNEELWTEPVDTKFVLPDGRSTVLKTASPEQSLAWKLVWLNSDMYPQGKDLYDATLLAESYPLSTEVLRRVLDDIKKSGNCWDLFDAPDWDWDCDWTAFQVDYPQSIGTEKEYLKRLLDVLKPAMADLGIQRPGQSAP
jgi:hypothetical protein